MPTLRQSTINTEKRGAEQPELAARAKREEIFAQIAEQRNRQEALAAVKRVFEHSVEDGIKLSNRLNLTDTELAEVVMSPGFVIKHHRVFTEIIYLMHNPHEVREAFASNEKHKKIATKIIDLWNQHINPALNSGDWSEFEEKLEQERDLRRDDKLLDEIDSYYAPLLKTRQIIPERVRKEYPVGEKVKGIKAGETLATKSPEQLADEALWQQQLLLFPAYYSESVREIIRRYQKQHQIEGEFRLPEDDIFTVADDIEQECDRLGIPFEEIEPRLKHARYISSTVGIKTRQAEKGLVKKLNESLKDRGQKVQLAGDKYEVVEDEKNKKEKESDYWDEEEILVDINNTWPDLVTINGVNLSRATVRRGDFYYIIEGTNTTVSPIIKRFDRLIDSCQITRKQTKLFIEVKYTDGTADSREVELFANVIDEYKKKMEKPSEGWDDVTPEETSDLDGYRFSLNGRKFILTDKIDIIFGEKSIPVSGDISHYTKVTSVTRIGNKIIIKGFSWMGDPLEETIFLDVDKIRQLEAEKKKEKENISEGEIEAKLLTEKSLGRDVYELAGMKLSFTEMSGMIKGSTLEVLYNIDTGRLATEGFGPFKKVVELYYKDGKIHIIGKYVDNLTELIDLEIRDDDFMERLKKFQLEQKEKDTEQKEFDFAKFEAKALDYIDQLLKDGANKELVAQGLAGLDSDRAWEMRERLIKNSTATVKEDIAIGLAGLDSDRAWEMRERLTKESVSMYYIAIGLAGLDSDRAWEMRERLIKDGADKSWGAQSLAGLDSDRAWEMRERLIKDGANKNHIAIGLAGLDSDRAWEMRERLLRENVFQDYITQSLAGLDSDRAWEMRERLLREGANKDYIAISLAGLDSDRAWEMREQLIKDGKDGSNKGWVAQGLAGDYITFVWQLKLKERKDKAKELTKEEQEQLKTLNLLHHPTSDKIFKHFEEKNLKEKGGAKQNWKKLLSGNRFVTSIINRIIGEEPKLFLDTIPAKRDRLPGVFAKQLAEKIFPEILQASRETAWHGFSGYSGVERGDRTGGSAGPEDCLNPNSSQELTGGGVEMMNDDREVMEFREALNNIIATNIYGRHNPSSQRWERVDFSVSAPLIEPTMETTVTLPQVKNLSAVSLPKPLEAKVIPERVKGFDAQGKEYDLAVEVNNLGEAKVVNKPKGVEKIVYSLAVTQAPEPLRDLSPREYKQYKKQLETAGGKELTSSLAGIPEDLELELLTAIEGKNPKEQVMAIERLVRDLSYYDFNNQEVNQLKRGKPLEEQLYVMEQRLEELRQTRPELAPELRGKKFAGVCADFAQLTATLLRRAGLASGIIVGFSGQDKTVRMKHAHATAFVVWPDETGKNRVISVDGTPDGVAGVSLPSLVEQEKELISKERGQSAEAIKRVQEIIDGLTRLDVETVRKMSNGELERVLNSILKYQVKESHLAIIESLLNFYWYTPVHQLDLANPYQQGEAMLKLAGAVKTERRKLAQQPEKDETPAGNKLMQMMQDFLGRFVVAGATEDKNAAINLMEKIVELAQNDLSEVEKKSAFAILAYLKAKNILGNKL